MFLMVIVSFLRFAMQKYSISQNEKQLVKPFRGLVYHVAKIQKNKRLDFKLLQNRNPTVVYGGVYVVALVETRLIASLQDFDSIYDCRMMVAAMVSTSSLS